MHIDAYIICHLTDGRQGLPFFQGCCRNAENDLVAKLLVYRFITAEIDLD
jgi:hypothetical protein